MFSAHFKFNTDQYRLFFDFHKTRQQNPEVYLLPKLFLCFASIVHNNAHCAMKEASRPKLPGIFANGECKLLNNVCKADNRNLLPKAADLLYDVHF